MNSIQHYRNVKQFNNMINSYQKKLDDKVTDMFNHMINFSQNTHDITLPRIENKKIVNEITSEKMIETSRRKNRTRSIHSKSFVINNDLSQSQEVTEADNLLKTFKTINEKQSQTKKNQNSKIMPPGRSIGGQIFVKPKVVKRKPQILSKEMRWDPFCQKNAIKAQELNQGMLSLIERGKVAKNIDIITAFEKGRPVLQTHQAVVHYLQQKFTNSFLHQSQMNQGMRAIKKQIQPDKNPQNVYNEKKIMRKFSVNSDELVRYNNQPSSSWALTIPQDNNTRAIQEKEANNSINLTQNPLQLNYIHFLHYKIMRDETYFRMKKFPDFVEEWGQIQEIVSHIEKLLKKYNIETIYCNSNKILQLAKRRQSIKKLKIQDIEECLVSLSRNKDGLGKKKRIFSVNQIINHQSKVNESVALISSIFKYNLIRIKYMDILHRKRYQNKVKQWIRNGFIIKNYRKSLQCHKEATLKKFQQQQRKFRTNFQQIQQNKHYEIHISNRHYMKDFKYFEEYCNTEITRIFNLENNNTNIIYISPFELNVETINYYFKIMELEEIENYNERVTFLELEDITAKIKLPNSMSTSQKLYFNSKALRKLKRKIQGVPAYFVTNYPSLVDINLSVFLQVPIYSGDFNKINPLRSALYSERFLCQSLGPTPAFVIHPKQFTSFQLSNALIRYFQSNKRNRKYIIKINNYTSSSGLALLTYPFSSLPEMYNSTVFIQSYYFSSVQKFYVELTKRGGVIQKYEEGLKSITVCAKISPNKSFAIEGTFEKVSNGFVNVGYIFPQKLISHKILSHKCKQILQKLVEQGHIGYVQLTLVINVGEEIFLEEVELYSTKITNSLFYFKFLAGGYLNHSGEFMTKIAGEGLENDEEQNLTLQQRSYCYLPFILHFGLSEQQASSFFQLCRIGGVSFDLQNKYGTTFIILGTLKDSMGILTTAKDRKSIIKLVSKSAEFLIKQNSHNISTEMLKEKEVRMRERFNISSIKDKIEQLL